MTVQTPEIQPKTILTLSEAPALDRGSTRSLPDAFLARVDTSAGPDRCWPWTGSRNPGGYGFGTFGWTRHAHREAYRLANGEFDTSLDVCHSCDNPPCVNPAHLWLGTHSENLLDASRKGRLNSATGERHGQSKLTWEKVRAIRAKAANGASERALSREYGVSQPAIHFVITRETWANDPLESEAVA
jgi:hypothetical protein